MEKRSQDDAAQEPNNGSEGVPAPDGPANLIDTDYVIGQDNVTSTKFGIDFDLHGKVFTISSLMILFFVIVTLAFQNQVAPIFNTMFSYHSNIIEY